jgi:hypothetical protein
MQTKTVRNDATALCWALLFVLCCLPPSRPFPPRCHHRYAFYNDLRKSDAIDPYLGHFAIYIHYASTLSNTDPVFCRRCRHRNETQTYLRTLPSVHKFSSAVLRHAFCHLGCWLSMRTCASFVRHPLGGEKKVGVWVHVSAVA